MGSGVWGLGFGVWGLGCGVTISGRGEMLAVFEVGLQVSGFVCRVSGFGFWVSGFGFQISSLRGTVANGMCWPFLKCDVTVHGHDTQVYEPHDTQVYESDTQVYEPQIRAFLGTASQFCELLVLTSRTEPIVIQVNGVPWRMGCAGRSGCTSLLATSIRWTTVLSSKVNLPPRNPLKGLMRCKFGHVAPEM